MWSRRPGAALLVVLAVIATGCGGADTGAENAYVGNVQRAQSAYVARLDQALSHLTATSTPKQDRATLASFADIAARFRSTLVHIKPPTKVAAQHRSLIEAVSAVRKQFVDGGARLARGSAADRAEVRTQLSSTVATNQERFARAISAINAGLHG